MKIEGKISILINRDSTTIEIEDSNGSIKFVRVTLTPEQLSCALARQAYVDCELDVNGLDRVGKKHECKSFEFEINKEMAGSRNELPLHQAALKALSEAGASDWAPDKYYGSQNSFFEKEGKKYARVTIRRWI